MPEESLRVGSVFSGVHMSAGSTSASSEQATGSSSSARRTPGAEASSPSTGLGFPASTTFEGSRLRTRRRSIFSAAAFPVSPSVSRVSARGETTSGGYGPSSPALSPSFSRSGC
jgi:hypothetical protein